MDTKDVKRTGLLRERNVPTVITSDNARSYNDKSAATSCLLASRHDVSAHECESHQNVWRRSLTEMRTTLKFQPCYQIGTLTKAPRPFHYRPGPSTSGGLGSCGGRHPYKSDAKVKSGRSWKKGLELVGSGAPNRLSWEIDGRTGEQTGQGKGAPQIWTMNRSPYEGNAWRNTWETSVWRGIATPRGLASVNTIARRVSSIHRHRVLSHRGVPH